jgi:hypothetical protein
VRREPDDAPVAETDTTRSLRGAPQPSYPLPALAELKKRHRTLMVQYLEVLDAAAADKQEHAGPLDMGRLARLMVGSHIRVRTIALAKRYAQLRQGCEAESATAGWLRDVQESSTAFGDALYSLRLPSVFVLIPFGLTMVAQAAKVPGDIYLAAVSSATAVYLLATPVVIFVAFRGKRDLFLPGARDLETNRSAKPKSRERNVYETEDQLFDLLRATKRREVEIDAWVERGAVAAAFAGLAWLVIWKLGVEVSLDVFWVGVVVAVFGGNWMVERRYRNRRWR